MQPRIWAPNWTGSPLTIGTPTIRTSMCWCAALPVTAPILSLTGAISAKVCGSGRKRSEEHTSELQSLMRISYAVFCLKKKNKKLTTYLIYDEKQLLYSHHTLQ